MLTLAMTTGLIACAGRAPNPVTTIQPYDNGMDCMAIQAEMEANTAKLANLSSEQNWKAAQNVGAAVTGVLLFWPAFFAMDMQDAAGIEETALQRRNSHLSRLAYHRCNGSADVRVADNSRRFIPVVDRTTVADRPAFERTLADCRRMADGYAGQPVDEGGVVRDCLSTQGYHILN